MIDYLTSFEFMSFLAIFVYWVPALVCLTVYLFRSLRLYRLDLEKCTEKFYSPSLTIGLIVWMVICAVTPGINLFTLVFDCASSVFKWLGSVLNIPLVPKRREERA